jgi:hypothetical protein
MVLFFVSVEQQKHAAPRREAIYERLPLIVTDYRRLF